MRSKIESKQWSLLKALFGTVAGVSTLRISKTRLEARFSRFRIRTLKLLLILRCVVLEHASNAGRLADLFRIFGSNAPHKRKQTCPEFSVVAR